MTEINDQLSSETPTTRIHPRGTEVDAAQDAEIGELRKELSRVKSEHNKQIAKLDKKFKDHFGRKHRCDFSHMEHDELRGVIMGFQPDALHGAGKKFLVAILESQGREGLESFMHRMEAALEEGRSIEPELDFLQAERVILKKVSPVINRRDAIKQLITYGGIGAGIVANAVAAGEVVEDVQEYREAVTPEAKKDFWEEKFGRTKSTIETLHPLVDVTAGAVAIAASMSELNKMKLEQVSEAISELALHSKHNRDGKEGSKLAELKTTIKAPRDFRDTVAGWFR
jgi:hypothetical protein